MYKEVPCELSGQPLAVLNALAVRSEYLYHILKAMEEAGVENPDEILKKAVYRVGQTWSERFGPSASPSEFFQKLVHNDDMKGILKWECIRDEEDYAEYHFHHCPLIYGWKRMGLMSRRSNGCVRSAIRSTMATWKPRVLCWTCIPAWARGRINAP
jgi:hypothetical protein